MSPRLLILLSVMACAPTEETADLPSLDGLQPPPPALLPPPCAPGSSFEVDGQAAPTLSAAAELAQPGDTIVACAGTHVLGDVYIRTPNLIIRGETGDPADVVFRGGAISHNVGFARSPHRLSFEVHAVSFVDDAELGVGLVGRFVGGDLIFSGASATAFVEAEQAMFFRTSFSGARDWTAVEFHPGYNREVVIALDQVTLRDHISPSFPALAVYNHDFTPRAGRLMMRDVEIDHNRSTAFVPMIMVDTDMALQIAGGSLHHNQTASASVLQVFGIQSDSWIRGWSVTDNNTGYPAVNLVGSPNHVWLTDSSFLRNELSLSGLPFPLGSALAPEGPTMHLRDVDFGTGADNNTPLDIAGCPTELGVASGVIRYPGYCPR